MTEPTASQEEHVTAKPAGAVTANSDWFSLTNAWHSRSQRSIDFRAPDVHAYAKRQDRLRKRAARYVASDQVLNVTCAEDSDGHRLIKARLFLSIVRFRRKKLNSEQLDALRKRNAERLRERRCVHCAFNRMFD